MALVPMDFEEAKDSVHTLETNVIYTKRDGMVIVSITGNTGVTFEKGVWTTLGTLPSGYRPSETWTSGAAIGGNIDYNGAMRVTSAGNVGVFQNQIASGSSVAWGNITFPIS